MPGLDPEFGTSILRLWVAAGSAILLVLFCVLALFQPQLRIATSPARRAGFVIAGAALGAVITWAFLGFGAGDRGAERRAFEMRAEQLSAQALAPGSPLACLDALAGEAVEMACEKALFMSPARVAAASSYVAARLTLLSSMAAYTQRGGADIDDLLVALRRSLEADRFGFVAHVLAIRDGCTGQNCKTLALLHDPSHVRANLSADAINQYLDRYAALWGTGAEGAVADATQPQTSPPAQLPHKIVNADFPSAASIPPVSIMNPEPTGPVLPGVAAAAAANPNPPGTGASSARHTRKAAATTSATITGQSASPGTSAVEPIWPEPMPSPPPSTATPQTASTPPATAPVQLAPPNPGAATRTQ